MNLALLLLPALIMFGVSFFKNDKAKYLLAFTSFVILLPIIELFLLPKPYNILGSYLVADKLDTYVLLVSSIVGIGVTLALLTLDKHVKVSPKA